MKANRLSEVQKELSQKGNITLEDLNISEDIQDNESTMMHYIGINTFQVEGSYELSLQARVVKITSSAYKRNKGLNKSFFDDVILLHDGSKPVKKTRAKAAPKADTDK